MKSSIIPWTCGLALTAMMGAGISHWFSVRELVATLGPALPKATRTVPAAPSIPKETPEPAPAPQTRELPDLAAKDRPTHAPSAGEHEAWDLVIGQLKALKEENQNLHDQISETNRDLMGVQFRIDTFSDKFKPLKVANDAPAATIDEGSPGVLPPRAIIPNDDLPRLP